MSDTPAANPVDAAPAIAPADIAALGFEEALRQLEEIVRALEDGRGRLDDAVAAYERGTLLKRQCEAKLAEAQARIERVMAGPDGAAKGLAPFDQEAGAA